MRIIKIFFLLLCLSFSSVGFCQGYFKGMNTKQKKYFIGAGYGISQCRWYSSITHSELYDKNGGVIKEGEVKFQIENKTTQLNLEVLMPVKKIRLGLGIAFEEFFLDKLTLEKANKGSLETQIVFDETFLVNKLFVQIEVPFKPETASSFSLNFNGRLGYFNFSGVNRINFFGEEPMAKTYFSSAGILADYKLYPHIYVFVFPHLEFKYFDNSRLETPSDIVHKIFSGVALGGLRIDMSKE